MRPNRTWLKILLTFVLLVACPSYPQTFAAASERPTTVEEVLQRINQDMHELYGLGENYFKQTEIINGSSLALRKDLIIDRINRKPEQDEKLDYKSNTFEIVYGSDHGDKLVHKGKKMREYSGYSKDGHSISTEGLYNDHVVCPTPGLDPLDLLHLQVP